MRLYMIYTVPNNARVWYTGECMSDIMYHSRMAIPGSITSSLPGIERMMFPRYHSSTMAVTIIVWAST